MNMTGPRPEQFRFKRLLAVLLGVLISPAVAGSALGAATPLAGTVRAWGANWHGQLGAWVATSGGVSTATSGPACPLSLDNILGGCYVGGTLGANGPNPNPAPDPVPGPVLTIDSSAPYTSPPSLLVGVTAVAGGYSHSLALKSDETVVAWGDNGRGQLGDGTTYDHSTPVAVAGLSGITSLAAGAGFSLALRADGTVWSWGSNQHGQLGNNSTTVSLAQSSSPVQVSGTGGTGVLTGVTAIAAGANHGLALRSDQSVVAWGYNASGQLGNGSTADSAVPVVVGNLTGVVAIAGGGSFSLGVKAGASPSANTVWAWGANNYGQLGNSSTADTTAPVQVAAVGGMGFLTGITTVAGGLNHSLGLRVDKTVVSWGYNYDGELGNGATTDSQAPVQVTALSGIAQIAAGAFHSLALGSNGSVSAWGSNQYGQLGAVASGVHTVAPAPYTYSATPLAVLGLAAHALTVIAGGGAHSLGVMA